VGKTFSILGAGLVGALLWRIRGGFLPTGNTTIARMIATLPMAALGGILAGPAGLLAGLLTFPELALTGWSQYFKMVGPAKQIYWSNVFGMTFRGLFQTAGTGLALGSPWLAVAGMAMGPIYLASNYFLKGVYFGKNVHFIDSYTAWGELFTGAWIYGAFMATLLAQNSHHARIVSCIK
jgi:hypothetical protein